MSIYTQTSKGTGHGEQASLWDPQRWGLPMKAIKGLEQDLTDFWFRYRACFKTRTRGQSQHAYHYLSGVLRMEAQRNFAQIARKTKVPQQNMHHFMSNSPWSAQAVFRQIHADIAGYPQLREGGVLILDESADEKSGEHSAGTARQYNGRLGKVDISQVGVFLAYVNFAHGVWTWIAGELFLPEAWFAPEQAALRQRLGIPQERTFATKVKLGWQMIQQILAQGVLPFEAVACDTLYGQSGWFWDQLRQAGVVYIAEVPRDTQVYLSLPTLAVPPRRGNRGRHPIRPQVVSGTPAVAVHSLSSQKETRWQRVRVRSTERGVLEDEFAARRVWTVHEGEVAEEWLVMRKESNGRMTYALSNAPADTPLERLAYLKSQRYFCERAHQEAKSEVGWDELQAQKYTAWMHHLAMTILATWFIAETKLRWVQRYSRDPRLAAQFEVEVLPALSVANVRTLLKAVMPLPKLSPEEAQAHVIELLVRRTRSRKSRLKAQHHSHSPP